MNNKNTKPVNYDKTRLRTNRTKSNSYHQDSDSSAKSPNSTSLTSDERDCVFVRDSYGYGFKITGNAPVKVQAVRINGSAWKSGLRENDIILKVNGESVIHKQHSDVVSLIRKQTKVELFVKNGDPIPSPNFASFPTRTSQISPPVIKKPRKEIEKPLTKLIKPPLKPLSISDLSSSKNNLSPPTTSQGNTLDRIRRSTESIGKSSDSHSDCSIGTSSTETDLHSHNYNYNKPKSNLRDMPESDTPPPKSKIVASNIPDLVEPNIPPSKQKIPKPFVLPKPNFHGSDYMPHKNTPEQLQLSKLDDSFEKDSPVKSHSYNASSNNSSKLFHDPKLRFEDSRNKTIPTDKMKSNNMLAPNRPNPIQKSKSISNNGLILGREFDDNQEDEDSDGSITIIELLSDTKDAISRPGIVAVLLNNVNDQPTDLNAMMLYYACKFYRSIDLKKDSESNACRMANEIITSFLLEKSPMFVDVGLETVEDILKNLKSGENMKNIFDRLLKVLLKLLDIIVERLKGRIQLGILDQTELPKLGNEVNKDMEIGQLHRTVCNILNKHSKNVDPSDYIVGKFIGLATIFQYFHKPTFSHGSAMRSRSTDGINTLGNQAKLLPIIDLYKCSMFCSAYTPKIFSSIRKKPKSISGHAVIDAVCLQPEDCGVCESVLWGIAPQGCFCTVCQTFFHMNCKKKIKVQCSRKSRKSIIISGNKEEKPSTTLFGRLSRKSSTVSVKNVNSQSSIEVNSNVGKNIFNNNSLALDEKTSHNTYDENTGVSKAKSEDQLHRINSSMEPNNYIVNGSSVNISMENNNGGSFQITSTVQIQELVTDESMEDPDMKVDESFDAGGEINTHFPNLDPNADKKRLIVLLEFYHKTRYILMNLKRFLYKLVNKWPPSQNYYFKALSLDCIQPFVNLIKSLVTAIEGCIKEQDFVDLETAVLNWLSENKDHNLQEWINLSSNLCCTNSLYIVKQLKQTTMRTIPELNSLLNVKMHKMVIVEELTQIRPLLISLPLIVKNIIKCLTKSEPLYTDQLMIWCKVSIKMDYLCEYIDRCCVPLVDWINNGSIGKRIDRSEWYLRPKETECVDQDIISYCTDFPRTLFHFPIFDFQMAKIFSWSRNQRSKLANTDSRINYFKKGAEVLLIFYKTLIVVLQKENDHYILKPIKPFKNVTERIFPIIEKNAFMATNGGQEDDCYILNIINKKQEDASLIRVGFTRKEFVENWLDYFSSDKHDLARSISLYKLNDIKDISNPNMSVENNNFNSNTNIKLKATDSTYSGHSTISTTPSLTDTKMEDSIPDPEPEPEPASKEKISAPVELIEGLTKASEIFAGTNVHLCKFLNINEDHSDLLEAVKNQGPKSLEEITLMFYSICGPMIDLTRHLIVSGSIQNPENANINKEDLKKTLFHISDQLKNIDFMKYTDKVDFTDESPNSITTNDGKAPEYCPTFCPREALNGNLSESETNSIEIVQEVKEIINEIVEKSIDQIQQEPAVDKSYKYMPGKSLVSAMRENLERSSFNLTPSYHHLTNPIEETITTTRAQIVLNRSHNNN